MDTDHAAFMAEILAHPDDDTPRLIYADWLEEQGSPRGEFIRLQCQIEQMPIYEPQRWALASRANSILAEFRDEWAAELGQSSRDIEFHRGFIDTLTCRVKKFAERGDQLYRSTPVHWLRLTHFKGEVEKLLKSGRLSLLRAWNCAKMANAAEFHSVFQSKDLHHLEELNASFLPFSFDQKVGSWLANSQIAGRLKTLNFYGVEAKENFFKALTSGDGFPVLESLTFGGGYSTTRPAEFKRLRVPQLTKLKVGSNLRVVDVEQLCHLPQDQIVDLDLRGTTIPAKGLVRLATAGTFQSVETLRLEKCNLTDRAMTSLLQAEFLEHCTSLNLAENPRLTTETIRRLAEHEPLANLRLLDLTGTPISGEALDILARSSVLQNLQVLGVYVTEINESAEEILRNRLKNGYMRSYY